jgi:hypothetical protein
MNERIKELAEQATMIKEVDCEGYLGRSYTRQEEYFDKEKFAELIVKECADAADMAYDARCANPGDYIAEQLGYGVEEGVTEWRTK